LSQAPWSLSLAASVAFAMTETTALAGLRDWAKGRSAWLGKLASCGYCQGHWIAFGLLVIYRPRIFEA
jgi:uncharacterized protein DUF1360